MKISMEKLEKALLPYEEKLQAHERRRRILGVKEVDRPTYERYIIGTVKQFDRRRNAFMTLMPNNPFGEDFRRRFKLNTGHDNWKDSLPYTELEPEDRIGQSLASASWRLCNEYFPESLPITGSGGRLEIKDKKWITRLIKKVALFFGAEMVFITNVDQRWVYQGIDIPHKYVIVIIVSHIRSLNNTAPSHFSWLSATDTYSRLKFITTQLTDFIRGLGYDANYRETLGWNPEMLMVPTAIDAGVGEFARNGRVLSPEFGINMRLKPVTTDLPLELDKPISFGVHEFCMVCENCASYCPARAIPFGPPTDIPPTIHNNAGFRKWYVNAEKCLTFWATNKKKWLSCGGRCISVCPWNKTTTLLHNTVRWVAIQGSPKIKRLLVKINNASYRKKIVSSKILKTRRKDYDGDFRRTN
jgi:reductive dehalogenase